MNAVNINGRTALHIAASRDRTDAAALLLQYGAAVKLPGHDGLTPVLIAAACSSAACVQLLLQLLLDAGAAFAANTPVLHAAVKNSGHPEVLQLLLEQSSAAAIIDNVTKQCSCCGPRTAVMMCEQPAHLRLLLAAGADAH
jgi:ankyrin repeat protein